jgi:hypothetical protein
MLIRVRQRSYSMYHIPPWEANSSSPIREIIPHPLQITEHNFSFPWPQTVSLKSILILPTRALSRFANGFFPRSLPHQNSASVPYVPLRDLCLFTIVLQISLSQKYTFHEGCVGTLYTNFHLLLLLWYDNFEQLYWKWATKTVIQELSRIDFKQKKRISSSITWFNKHREATSWKIAIICWHY